MLEIPESHVLAQQLNETIQGKIISFVQAGHTPHSFTWYSDNPEGYDDLLAGKRIGISRGIGGDAGNRSGGLPYPVRGRSLPQISRRQ